MFIVDCDVPRVKSVFRSSPDAMIFHIDYDPLKVNTVLLHFDVEVSIQADMRTALEQVIEAMPSATAEWQSDIVSAAMTARASVIKMLIMQQPAPARAYLCESALSSTLADNVPCSS